MFSEPSLGHRTKHSSAVYSKYLESPWVSTFLAIHGRKSFSVRMTATFVYDSNIFKLAWSCAYVLYAHSCCGIQVCTSHTKSRGQHFTTLFPILLFLCAFPSFFCSVLYAWGSGLDGVPFMSENSQSFILSTFNMNTFLTYWVNLMLLFSTCV